MYTNVCMQLGTELKQIHFHDNPCQIIILWKDINIMHLHLQTLCTAPSNVMHLHIQTAGPFPFKRYLTYVNDLGQ